MSISICRHSGIVNLTLEDDNAFTCTQVTPPTRRIAFQTKKEQIPTFHDDSDSESESESEYECSPLIQADLNDKFQQTSLANLLDGM